MATITMTREDVVLGEATVHRGLAPDAPAIVPSDESFLGDFMESPILEGIGERLRERHDMPTEIRVKYLWKRKGGKHQGNQIGGFAAKLSGLAKHYADADFVIWVAADATRERKFTNHQLEALMFHELGHVDIDPDTLKPIVRGHEYEGFTANIVNYGLWKDGLEPVADAFAQARMKLG